MGKRKKPDDSFEHLIWNFSGKQITEQRKGPYWHFLLFSFLTTLTLYLFQHQNIKSIADFLNLLILK